MIVLERDRDKEKEKGRERKKEEKEYKKTDQIARYLLRIVFINIMSS